MSLDDASLMIFGPVRAREADDSLEQGICQRQDVAAARERMVFENLRKPKIASGSTPT